MSRVKINEVIWEPLPHGNDVLLAVARTTGDAGVSVEVLDADGDPVTVYAAATGPTTLANPLTSNPDTGELDGWLAAGGTYTLNISGPGIETTRTITMADSPDRRVLLSGLGAPSNGLGVDEQLYVDLANDRLYGPKSAGAWPGSYIPFAAEGSGPIRARAETLIPDSVTTVYTSGAVNPSPTAERLDALQLDAMTVGDTPLMLHARLKVSVNPTSVSPCVGIWDGDTELRRDYLTPPASGLSTTMPRTMDVWAPVAADDGETEHDFHVRWGPQSTTPGTVTLYVAEVSKIPAHLIAWKSI